MKVLLYSEGISLIRISGLGRAISHQKKALENHSVTVFTDKKMLKECDIVHINTLGIASKRIAKIAKKMNKTVVYHAHSTEEDFRNSFIGSNLLSKLFKKWICSCYNCGDVIITPTEYSKKLLTGYGIEKPIYAISNGIDLSFYRNSENCKSEFRSKYGYTEKDKIVMSVGLFFERKGILDFIKLAYAMPDYKFIWFGKTPLISVPYKIRQAVKTKLPNLTFAGYVSPDELADAYRNTDVYIFPTYEETEGIVLLEALASSSDIIVRDIPVFDWLKKDTDCYKAKNCDEFKFLIQCITNRKICSLAQNGRRAVRDKDLSFIGYKLIKIYDCFSKSNREHHPHNI